MLLISQWYNSHSFSPLPHLLTCKFASLVCEQFCIDLVILMFYCGSNVFVLQTMISSVSNYKSYIFSNNS